MGFFLCFIVCLFYCYTDIIHSRRNFAPDTTIQENFLQNIRSLVILHTLILSHTRVHTHTASLSILHDQLGIDSHVMLGQRVCQPGDEVRVCAPEKESRWLSIILTSSLPQVVEEVLTGAR